MLGRIFVSEVAQLMMGQYGFPKPQASALCLLDGLKDPTIYIPLIPKDQVTRGSHLHTSNWILGRELIKGITYKAMDRMQRPQPQRADKCA